MKTRHSANIWLCALLLTLLLPGGCSEEKAKEGGRAAAPVRVEEVKRDNVARILRAVGNVRPSASVDIVPRVAGEIVEVKFREGEDVRAGQPLLRIDPRPYEAALREKRAMLAKSEAQLAKALDDRRRFGKLVGPGYVSRDAFEQTATDAAALRATVQADKAAVESAALDLSYCSVAAPISGRIGALKLDKGNMVKSNSQEPVASINAVSPCYVSFSVAEAHLPAILEGMASGEMRVTAKPTGGKTEDGLLTLIDNNVDEKTGTIRLRATFENKGRRLWPGQFVETSLPLGEIGQALLVPTKAVQAGRDESYVFIVDENNAAQYRKVNVLFETDGKSVIEADLNPGDKVVVDGQVRLAQGLPVNIINQEP